MQEESPEGGRFKKEILVDNQSYLLLIRDEGGPPELQVRLCNNLHPYLVRFIQTRLHETEHNHMYVKLYRIQVHFMYWKYIT